MKTNKKQLVTDSTHQPAFFSKFTLPRLLALCFIFVFASIGAYLILFSHASSLTADFNNDSRVSVLDLSILATNWGKTSATQTMGDANSDNTVNVIDLSILASQWGQVASPTPTPPSTPTPTGQPANSINVKDYGAKGDGVVDDTANLMTAFNVAVSQGKIAYLPSGTYVVKGSTDNNMGNAIAPPNGLTIKGQSMSNTWLKGRLYIKQNQTITDLKIGVEGYVAVSNIRGSATNSVTLERVHLRGGGGGYWNGNAVIELGIYSNVSNVTFKSCEVERSYGIETTSTFTNNFNNISLYENTGAHLENITFDNCQIGVSNGRTDIPRNIGSPRMGLEAYVEDGSATGFKNIAIKNSTFEATDAHAIDFSDDFDDNPNDGNDPRGYGVLVENTLIKGGGMRPTSAEWGYSLNLEMPYDAIIRNNTIWRSKDETFYMTDRGDGHQGPRAVITGNYFNLAYDNGITPTGNVPIHLLGDNNIFTGNTITLNYSDKAIDMDGCTGNIVTNNIAHIGGRTFIYQYGGSSGNTITPNTVD